MAHSIKEWQTAVLVVLAVVLNVSQAAVLQPRVAALPPRLNASLEQDALDLLVAGLAPYDPTGTPEKRAIYCPATAPRQVYVQPPRNAPGYVVVDRPTQPQPRQPPQFTRYQPQPQVSYNWPWPPQQPQDWSQGCGTQGCGTQDCGPQGCKTQDCGPQGCGTPSWPPPQPPQDCGPQGCGTPSWPPPQPPQNCGSYPNCPIAPGPTGPQGPPGSPGPSIQCDTTGVVHGPSGAPGPVGRGCPGQRGMPGRPGSCYCGMGGGGCCNPAEIVRITLQIIKEDGGCCHATPQCDGNMEVLTEQMAVVHSKLARVRRLDIDVNRLISSIANLRVRLQTQGRVAGPPGPLGPKGQLGPKGDRGPLGQPGECPQNVCNSGPPGGPGLRGMIGEPGMKGECCYGERGPRGLKGTMGHSVKGPIGPKGSKGDRGDPGVWSMQGYTRSGRVRSQSDEPRIIG